MTLAPAPCAVKSFRACQTAGPAIFSAENQKLNFSCFFGRDDRQMAISIQKTTACDEHAVVACKAAGWKTFL
jgi:hypothetical protein